MSQPRPFARYLEHFENNTRRPLPVINDAQGVPDEHTAALVHSLQRFQQGETGEGRIAHQVDHVALFGTGECYRPALKLFVKEEGRHARVLGDMLRALDAPPLDGTWSESLFRGARGLIGVRTKLAVLLAAEVIAAVYYPALASRLGEGGIKNGLLQITDDEKEHLAFHSLFFRRNLRGVERLLFALVWPLIAFCACTLVFLDHRVTLAAFSVSRRELFSHIVRVIAKTTRGVLRDDPLSRERLDEAGTTRALRSEDKALKKFGFLFEEAKRDVRTGPRIGMSVVMQERNAQVVGQMR